MKTSQPVLLALFKVLIVIVIAFVLFFIGLMIGYGVFGDGSPFGVFSDKLWQHIFTFFL